MTRGLVIFCLAVLFALPSRGQGTPCMDVITIRDAGPGRAIVTYLNDHNGASGCSNTSVKPTVLVSPDGIEVEVWITVGSDEEKIQVEPTDPNMMAFPPVGYVLDGKTIEIIVMGGLA